MRFQDLPEIDRPREKAKRYGLETLSDAELLALLINNGYRGCSALDIANELLTKSRGLYNLNTLNQKDLENIKGIKGVKSSQLLSLFMIMTRIKNKKIDMENRVVTSTYIYERYRDYISNLSREVVFLLVLNRSKKIIFETTLYKGSSYLVPIEINEVIKNVILHDGVYFYLVHNHPGGYKEPSAQDLLLTLRLNDAVKKMKIRLLDHLIFHEGGFTSINDYLKHRYDYRKVLQIPAN